MNNKKKQINLFSEDFDDLDDTIYLTDEEITGKSSDEVKRELKEVKEWAKKWRL